MTQNFELVLISFLIREAAMYLLIQVKECDLALIEADLIDDSVIQRAKIYNVDARICIICGFSGSSVRI